MSAIIADNKLTLEADGMGFSSAIGQLRTSPPAGADAMWFFFRAYYDEFTENEDLSSLPWTNRFCFGLSFNGVQPSMGNRAQFFGLAPHTSGGSSFVYTADALGPGEPGVANNYRNELATVNGGTSVAGAAGLISTIAPNGAWDLPANPTVGAKYTGVWAVRKIVGNFQISIDNGYNMESLPLDDIQDARESMNTVWYSKDNRISSLTTWNPSSSLMVFPEYLIFSNPSAVVGRKLVIERVLIQWWSYNKLIGTTLLEP